MTGDAAQPPFRSFFMGGFEGSTQRRNDGVQLDIVAATQHDRLAATDYAVLAQSGLRTVRDSLRWHLIEPSPGRYDWSSWQPMVEAANNAGVQVIWDVCHYGVPAHVDIWSPDFIQRFAAFAAAAAELAQRIIPAPRIWAPMNEISFWAWAGGDTGYIHPATTGRGHELKRQLVAAAIAASKAIRAIDPGARFVQPEPLINIIGHPDRPEDKEPAEQYRTAQYQAWDMISGRIAPELGGREDLLDIIGINYYFNNQWIHEFETMGMGHRFYRPLADMLAEVHQRYQRPLLIAETGAEAPNGPSWLRYLAGEVRDAKAAGVPMTGICLYPIMDYPGWSDLRHCPCGILAAVPGWSTRIVRRELVRQIEQEQRLNVAAAS